MIYFVLANSVDPDEMPPYLSFRLDFYSAKVLNLGVSGLEKVKTRLKVFHLLSFDYYLRVKNVQ